MEVRAGQGNCSSNLGAGHMMLCADDVLLSFLLETCLFLQTNVTLIVPVF